MRKRKIFSVLMAAAASASMLFAPVVAKADGTESWVRNYQSLVNAAGGNCTIDRKHHLDGLKKIQR